MNFKTDTKDILLSIIIPARDESACLPNTIEAIKEALENAGISFEIVVINDHSNDQTDLLLSSLSKNDPRIVHVNNNYPPGFGFAIRKGLDVFRGDAAVIVMADGSDAPSDIVKYFEKLKEGYDCVFGSRFCREAKVVNYPTHKMILNRIGNIFIQAIFLLRYNDITNAFKCYSRETIDGIRPLLSCHFNLTV